MYAAVKYIHVTCVTLSLAGFWLLNLWRWRAPERLRHPWVRVVPHLNDTLLLLSGVMMLRLLHWSPLTQPWLMAKLAALVVYVALGAVALRAEARVLRLGASVAATAVFLYIVSVAITKQVWPL